MTRWQILQGDALEILRSLETHSVDAIVTDPPSGIGFMNAEWDSDKGGRDNWIVWLRDIFIEARRVAKPGAHALVWSLPRTSHWTATGIEDAGWTLRDRVSHLFGTGFAKNHNISKALDAKAGAEREIVAPDPSEARRNKKTRKFSNTYGEIADRSSCPITAPATELAAQWEGWGTALEPAVEDWWLARAPLSESSIAANVAKWGTGAIHIDACRVERSWGERSESWLRSGHSQKPTADKIAAPPGNGINIHPKGGWPAHLVLDEEAADTLDSQTRSLQTHGGPVSANHSGMGYGGGAGSQRSVRHDEGGASRFFYVAKASTAERELGLEHFDPIRINDGRETEMDTPYQRGESERRNPHKTVKSVALMRWLLRLATPPSGLVLDLFAGSGTTGIACVLENARFLGIELDETYARVAAARIAYAEKHPRAFDPETRKAPKVDERQVSLFGDTP